MKIEILENDAPGFIDRVQACANDLVTLHPSELVVIRIKGWFGPKWLPFSAPTRTPHEGILANNLSVPLFVPNRVIGQRSFRGPNYEEYRSTKSVHIPVRTSIARHRLVSDLLRGSAMAWYSSGSAQTGRGAILAYSPVGERYHAWYAGWMENGVWRLALAKGTGVRDVARLVQGG